MLRDEIVKDSRPLPVEISVVSLTRVRRKSRLCAIECLQMIALWQNLCVFEDVHEVHGSATFEGRKEIKSNGHTVYDWRNDERNDVRHAMATRRRPIA